MYLNKILLLFIFNLLYKVTFGDNRFEEKPESLLDKKDLIMSAQDTNHNSNENWWRNAVIYQIYPRSFMDSNDDGIGDIKGITSKLRYLAETGIKAVWLSPIFASPMVDFGYDISDFKAIHHEYGTMKDFDDMIAEATKLGIKIILDFVPNHTSDQCIWFKNSENRVKEFEEFYVWADGKESETGERLPPNNWCSVFYGSAWTWSKKRQQYYLHQFTKEQPDLNFRNSKVVKMMDEIMIFWLKKGVSGFRIDALNHLFEDPELKDEPLSGKTTDSNSFDYLEHIYTKDLPEVLTMLQHWRKLLDDYTKENGGDARFMMSEAYTDIKTLMDYYETEDGLLGAHVPFNFILITDLNEKSDARDLVFNVQKWLTYMPRGHTANWVMGNHDQPRVASRIGAGLVDAMHMLLLTLPGVAVTYNGEEIGMEDYRDISWEDTVDPPALNVGPKKYKEVSRDPERTPFQWSSEKNAGFSNATKTWLPVHPNYKKLNLESQKLAEKSHYKVYKALLGLRNSTVLRDGRTHVEALNRNVLLLKRELKGHATILTIINLSKTKAEKVNLASELDCGEQKQQEARNLKVLVASTESSYEVGYLIINYHELQLNPLDALILENNAGECLASISKSTLAERRALIRTIIKSGNAILVGLLMYKLWNHKWTKLQINREALF